MRLLSKIGLVAALAMVGGCSDPLDVHIVGTVTDESINSAASADALRVGTLSSINAITAGGTGTFDRGWIDVGLFADEWRSSGPQQQYGELDSRSVPNTNVNLQNLYANLHRTRARAREAIDALVKYKPAPAWGIGQMYIALALAEVELAEYFCNGVPISNVANGQVAYGTPQTNAQIYALAGAHLDSAITFLSATDATTQLHLRLAQILKARVLLDIGGSGSGAAAAALVNPIPTSYAYQLTFAVGTGDNSIWSANTSLKAASVGDSIDALGTLAGAVPFGSANDPRVRVAGSSVAPSSQGFGADGGTPLVVQTIWGRSDPVNLASGLDARLIEAEARLQADDFAGMTTILNQLRAAPPALTPTYTPAALGALTAPTTKAAAVRLYFREKGFWTFGRGQRLGDLRRMIRQYGFTQDQVFPSGRYFKGGNYGSQVNLDVSSLELNNPNFTACIDRNA
jgi:starch-binding outer membrane protein, SusD/RagB family